MSFATFTSIFTPSSSYTIGPFITPLIPSVPVTLALISVVFAASSGISCYKTNKFRALIRY
jgi:hypothetical protein